MRRGCWGKWDAGFCKWVCVCVCCWGGGRCLIYWMCVCCHADHFYDLSPCLNILVFGFFCVCHELLLTKQHHVTGWWFSPGLFSEGRQDVTKEGQKKKVWFTSNFAGSGSFTMISQSHEDTSQDCFSTETTKDGHKRWEMFGMHRIIPPLSEWLIRYFPPEIRATDGTSHIECICISKLAKPVPPKCTSLSKSYERF